MTYFGKIGAAGFFFWGFIHVAGGGAMLAALRQGPDAGFAFYRHAGAGFPPLAGAVLGYLAFALVAAGAAVAVIAVRRNWRNDPSGLAANTAIAGLTELGLVAFLLAPGHLGLADAAPGLILFAVGAVFGGLACRGGDHATAAG